ncbi:MAG: CIA30 family protein [Bacteroidota bacterium]
MFLASPIRLIDFAVNASLSGWQVVDDGVMGGRSAGMFYVNETGHGMFEGKVSLANNGGFSSIRYRTSPKLIGEFRQCVIRLKGDGKRYQFRVKSSPYDRHTYIQYFQTNGEWQEIEISLKEMYPTFRGRRLNMPSYPAKQLSELAFLIANKRAESFHLEIDWVELR